MRVHLVWVVRPNFDVITPHLLWVRVVRGPQPEAIPTDAQDCFVNDRSCPETPGGTRSFALFSEDRVVMLRHG
jgi:hypothetical protein